MYRNGKLLLEHVEVAKRFWKKAKGLMFRKQMPEKTGMLFVFSREGQPGFWMFGMRFPIDIIYLNSHMQVIDIKENIKPMGPHPKEWKIYFPTEACKYVLEVNAGFVEKNKIRKMDVLELED